MPTPWPACAGARNRSEPRPGRRSTRAENEVVAPSQAISHGREFPFIPLQKLAKRRPPMAVPGLLLRAEFREGLLNLREIKQRIVSEPARAKRRGENHSFGRPAKRSQSLPIARGGQHAHEPSSALLRRNVPQF